MRREGDEAVVTVADTGIGVPAAEMPRLFERFHRIENARARSNEGSGIGLALVKELVGLHGGDHRRRQRRGRGHHIHHSPAVRHRASACRRLSRRRTRADGVSAAAEPYVQEALRWMPTRDVEAADGVR